MWTLESVMERCRWWNWRPWLSKLAGDNCTSLDEYLDALHGCRGRCSDSLHLLVNTQPWEYDRWLDLSAVMESRLMAVDCVGRHAGRWSYIQQSTCNHDNEGKTNNLGWMLYAVDGVLGVCCTRCILYSVYALLGVCCTQCMLYTVYAVLGVCCTRCMLYLVYVVLGVCCTSCILYSVYAVLSPNLLS
jgi:hypothetical protein